MTTSRKAIRLRWDQTSQPDSGKVESFNLITDLIDECGMVRLSDEEFSGQAGKFVEEDPGDGETAIGQDGPGQFYSFGYNAWRHPNRELYIRVNYLNHGPSGSPNYRFGLAVSLDIGTEISGGEFVGQTVNIRPLSSSPTGVTSSYNPSTISLKNTYLDCFAYLDKDCFWVGSEPQVITLTPQNSYYNSYVRAPTGVSPLSFGVFYNELGDFSVIYSEEVNYINDTGIIDGVTVYGYSGGSISGFLGQRTIRCYLKSVDGAFDFQIGFPLCTFNNVGISSDEVGVRATQAQAIINSKQTKFNIGFINGNAATDLTTLYLDLDGNGERPYKVMKSFGSATPDFWGATLEDVAVLLLPWSE